MKKRIIIFAILGVFLFFSVGFIESATSSIVKTKNYEIDEAESIFEREKKLINIIEKKSDEKVETLGLGLFLEYMKLAVATAIGGAFVLLVGCIILPLLPVGMFMIGAAGFFAILGVLALFVPE